MNKTIILYIAIGNEDANFFLHNLQKQFCDYESIKVDYFRKRLETPKHLVEVITLNNVGGIGTVSRLLNMLDELSMNGFGDMPVFLGENYPLLEDSISVNPSENKLYIRNTYYDEKMAEAIKKAINGMEDVRRAYIADCYKAGRRMDEKE
jgi:hypothetical protein